MLNFYLACLIDYVFSVIFAAYFCASLHHTISRSCDTKYFSKFFILSYYFFFLVLIWTLNEYHFMACLWIFIVFLKLFFIWPLTRVLGRWWRWRGRRWCSRWWGACSTVLLVQVWSSCLLTLLAWAESPSQEVWKTKSCQIVIFWKWHTFLDFKVEFFFNEPRCLWKGNRMFFYNWILLNLYFP